MRTLFSGDITGPSFNEVSLFCVAEWTQSAQGLVVSGVKDVACGRPSSQSLLTCSLDRKTVGLQIHFIQEIVYFNY